MAATTAPQPGIQGWMSSIRTAMVEDPNRKMFEEQVQTHGFQFFKEYLDNVLENAKQQDNTITDLLKTPGRRKGAPKKTRAAQAAAARAQDAIKFSFEDGSNGGKENGPVNKFHEALLQAKRTDESDDTNTRAPLSPKRHGFNPPESPRKVKGKGKGKAVKVAASDVADENHQAGFIDLSSSPAPPPADTKREASAPPKPPKELSMIAEDDEMLSRVPHRGPPAPSLSPVTYDISPTRNYTLAPPVEEEDDDMDMEDEAPAPPSPSPPQQSPLPVVAEHYPSPPTEPEHQATSMPPELPATLDEAEVAPVSQDVTAHPIPPHLRTSGKATLAAPPVAPSGLYASTSNTNMPAATAAATGTKRTSSWTAAAMKARGSSTTGTSMGNLAVAAPGHLKRKSGDMGPPMEPERVKHPKTSHGEAMEVDAPAIAFPAAAAEEVPADEEPLTLMLKRMQGSRQTTKSIGNAAVVAELALAKAAAERRVADKYGLEQPSREQSLSPPPVVQPREEKRFSREAEKRFSVSELFTSKEGKPAPSLAPPRPVDLSASTTPPDSPAITYKPAKPPAPVFTKPTPVFVPPPAPIIGEASTERSGLLGDFSFKLPAHSAFTRPQLGLGTAPLSKLSPRSPRADSGASTQESEPVDPVFDSQPLSRQVSNSTQGTSQSHSQSQLREVKFADDYVDYEMPLPNDEDDTWNIDEKLAATTQTWTPYTTGGNTDTWSSGPSDTQTQPAGAFTHPFANVDGATWTGDWPTDSTDSTRIRSSEAVAYEDADEFTDAHEHTEAYVDDAAEDVADAEQSGGIRLVQTKSADSVRPDSQLSMASSSDESQQGLMGQASKFVSSIFGGPGSTKKKDGPIKSVQMAAAAKVAAAKKAQEEEARKVTRQKEVEARRQAAIQRKAEEERQRAEAEERKAREAKEEVERRRKEREEAAAKREEAAAKRAKAAAEKKTSDDEANKKKVVEKPKSAMKKPAPVSKIVKPTPGPAAKPKPLSKQASTSSLNDKSMKFGPPKGKAKAPAPADNEPKAGPSSFKTPVPAPPPKPETPEEWIDLPEPNSEYSNSDDEDKGKDYDVADWAQSPVLFNQLREQETMDPDDIFGPIRPLRMEEMFTGRARQSRFRARSSSANWAHGDGLTEAEAREYARRMGFR